LLVRLWTTDEPGEPDPMFWKSAAPAVSLILDLVSASEGVVAATHDNILVANFSGIQKAISAARRLQWAVQGFTEGESSHGTAAAVLVHSAENQFGQTSDNSFLLLLKQAIPGQILLTEKTCQHLHNLPGFSLRAAPESGLQELLWRGPEGESARSFDERSLAQLIEQHGVNNADAERAEPTTTAPDLTTGDLDMDLPALTDLENKNVLLDATRHSPLGDKSPWLIGGACAVALLVALVVLIALSHRKTPASTIVANPVATPKAETTASPAGSGSLPPTTPPAQSVNPANSATQNQETPSKVNLRTPKDSRKHERATREPAEETSPQVIPPKPSGGRCDLDQQEIADELETAERSLARGLYSDSERQFGAVLTCEPGNGRARAGLERVRKAQTER